MSGPLFVKLETSWNDNPKIIAAGLAGRGLHATALCICKRLETDGWIDRALLYREGADDALIDRLVDLALFDVEGSCVRPHNWHDRNPSQDAIDATRSAKADAARVGNHKRWKHPGDVADCSICAPEPQVSRISDRNRSHPVATPSPDTETETDTTTLLKSQDYTGSAVPESQPDVEQAVAAPDEQEIRKTAALVGRTIAAAQVGLGNPSAYAAGVTRQILDTTGDGIDRERITRMLGSGETPEGIASGWATDPFGLPAASEPVLVGPDTAGFYAEREARRREQMAEQVPVDTVDGLAGLRAAREALRKQAAS